MARSATYWSWRAIKQRCHDPKHPDYRIYGARGITMCDTWRNSFLAFLADMGKQPRGQTIERIDNSLGYQPGNCKWADYREQNNNKRTNLVVTIDGVTGTLSQLGFNRREARQIQDRIRRGKTPQQAVDWIRSHRNQT